MNQIKEVNWMYLITVLIYIFASQLIAILQIPNGIASLLASQILLAAPAAIYLIIKKKNLKEMIRLKKIQPLSLFLLFIFAYLIMPLLSVLNAISMLFSTNVINGTITNIVGENSLIFGIIMIAFVPCVLEESVYRGIFYNEYRKVNTKRAIVLSGLLFGLLHMNFNQFIYAFAMGVIFALLIEATDSIIASMFVHFIINGNSVVLTYLLPKLQNAAENLYGNEAAKEMFSTQLNYSTAQLLLVIVFYGFIAIFTTSLAVLLYIAIAKCCGRWEIIKQLFKKSQNSSTKLISVPLIIAIVICLFIMTYIEIVQRIM